VETRDVVVRVFERNFSVPSVAIYSRQSVQWQWSDGFHNVLQVVSDGSRPVAVKGGIKSGLQRNSGSFSHEFQIPGCYQFVSQGHNPSVVLDITVIEKPPKNVKLSDDGFSPRYLEVQLGETVTWTWNECFRPQAVQRVWLVFISEL
jgi:plastocyanin